MDPQSLRHLHALRDFIRNLVEQAERSGGCECHRPPSLLLVGPPGAGKTYLVKQMSTVCEMPLFGVHTHQLTGPTSLRSLFVQARELDYPSLFFLDDIDSIFINHDLEPGDHSLAESLRQELYRQLGPRKLKIFDPNSSRNPVQNTLPNTPSPKSKGAHQDDQPDNNGLILVAATSAPWLLYKDHELLSRFRGVYLVGLPDRETRFHLLKFLLQKVQHNLTEKEFWLVADKTEGFTPSDLMIITKALNYEQFSFLFSMAGLQGYEGESSDEESISSSEMTETDIDSNSDHVDPPSERAKKNASTGLDSKEEKKETSNDSNFHKTSISSDESTPKAWKNTTLGVIEQDWSFDGDETITEKEEDGKCSEGKIDEDAPNVDDGAKTDSTPIAHNEEKVNEANETSPDNLEPSVSSNCDNSSNVMNSDVNLEGIQSSCVENVCSVSEAVCEKSEETTTKHVTSSNSDDETKEFKLHVFHPPDPFRNDNQAVDSGSDSDNENGGDFSKRTRRVNFCNAPSMHPLSVDVDHSDNIGPNNNLGYEPNVTISSGIEDSLLSKDPYCGPSANNILKRLLSSSPTLHDEVDDGNLNSKNTRNKEVAKDDNYRQDDYLDVYSNAELERGPVGEDETDSARTRNENKSQDLQTFPRSPSVRRNSLPEGNLSRTGVSPQLTGVSPQLTGVSPQLTGVSPQLTGVSPQLTPTGSDTSSHLATDNSSESGSGRRIRMTTPIAEREINKTRDSNSSLYGKSETPTIPSSDISTGTCNVSGETLECHSDSDERLRNLEDDLKGRRPRSSASEEDDEDELSGEENENDALRTIFNLNNLGEVSIKILTVNDVLNVVNRTPKSVSDEEIKRYTDFMVWFANVAKSACPHNSKGAMSDTASSADVSVDSSLWSHSPSAKKRKGPLKKLGRFLLKALMFILD